MKSGPPAIVLSLLSLLGCKGAGHTADALPADTAARPDVAPDLAPPDAAADASPDASPPDLAAPDVAADAAPDAGPAHFALRWAKRTKGAAPMSLARSADALIVAGNVRNAAVFGEGQAMPVNVGTSGGSVDGFLARFGDDGSFRWFQQMGVSRVHGVAVASGGDLVVGGEFFADPSSPSIFGERQPNETRLTNTGAFVARYTGEGQLSWVRANGERHSSSVVAVAPLPDGGSYVLGTFSDRIILAPGTPQQVTLVADVSPGGGGDSYLARYGADGTLAWARQLASPSNDLVSGMAVLESGDAVILGSYDTSIKLSGATGVAATLTAPSRAFQLYFARYSPAGALVWARQLGGAAEKQSRAIVRLASGDLLLAAVGSEGVDGDDIVFGPGEAKTVTLKASPRGNLDLFFARYDPDGHVVWARGALGATLLEGSIAALPDGGLALAAPFGSFGAQPRREAVFAPGESNETKLTFGRTYGSDLAVAWFSADGSLRKARAGGVGSGNYGQCIPSALTAGPDGSLTVVGWFEGPVTFGDAGEPSQTWQAGIFNGSAGPFPGDMFMLRYDP